MPSALPRRLAAWLAAAWLTLMAAWPAHAGVMTAATLRAIFPSPLILGERDAALPVWPVFKQEATATVLVAYVFESIDLAPVPGFSGTPMNLLVALDAQGRFMGVRVLSQHEPVFLDGLGEAPLLRFVEQYRGLSLQQSIKIGDAHERAGRADSASVTIDGVAKATASVRILNQSLLASALQVARAKLGYAAGRDPARVGHLRGEFAPLDWQALVDAGLVQHTRLTRAELAQAFAGTPVDAAFEGSGGAAYMDFWVTWLNLPAAGRNLLSPAGWQHLQSRLDTGDHALLVIAQGAERLADEHFVRGAVPDRLALQQAGLPLELRDLDLDDPLVLPPALQGSEAKVFRVFAAAGLDPAQALTLKFRVVRTKGIVYPERFSRDFALPYTLPERWFDAPPADVGSWRAVWASRAIDLGLLAAALALLGVSLARPQWLTRRPALLATVRNLWLAFTLVFVGWWAQGQLSIVNAIALVQALQAGRSLGFFLHDPVSLLLWAAVAVTLVVWGRGTFCGWLCPFGALQELVSQLAGWLRRRGLRLPRWRPHPHTDARLKRVKYGVLAALLGSAVAAPAWADKLVEIEPFKTAITLAFQRSWPHVLWAAALVLLSAVVYKGYCRYICPLGALLAVMGRLRRWDWIARRVECGTPCQTCRHRCGYQAIAPAGKIDYDECFQCLDCVAIHDDPKRCAPLVAQAHGGRVFSIRPLPEVRG